VGAGTLRSLPRIVVPLAVLAGLALVPYVSLDTHGVFSSDLDSPGSLQLLGLCLVFGAVALSYDLLFGFTGLLSFGHALYFALGVYVCNIALTRWEWSFWQALLLTAAVGLVAPLVLGAVSLRVTGIAFAMVTLAFAQAGNVLVHKNPDNLTGGDEGLGIGFDADVPSTFIGVFNTKHLYWLALGYAAAVFAIAAWAVSSSPGRVWQAIRENELRVQVLGLRPFWFKLMVFVLASFLATAGGVVYLLLIGGSSPGVTTASFTLALLIMVVLGGTGTLWGPIVGGVLYTFLDNRLVDWSASERVQDLPSVLSTPLSEPLFVLGVLFILIVFFLPGGIAGLATRRRRSGLEVLEAVVDRTPTVEAEEEVEARL
jgi:branched-chain amino acid transport system permease protein